MVRWIQDPRAIDSATATPPVDASEKDARDIAAYLYAIP
jgi:cytochrome c1